MEQLCDDMLNDVVYLAHALHVAFMLFCFTCSQESISSRAQLNTPDRNCAGLSSFKMGLSRHTNHYIGTIDEVCDVFWDVCGMHYVESAGLASIAASIIAQQQLIAFAIVVPLDISCGPCVQPQAISTCSTILSLNMHAHALTGVSLRRSRAQCCDAQSHGSAT